MIAGAAIALVFGWLGADPTLMWVSIGASVAAAVMLALGYNRSKVEVAAATRALTRPRAVPAERNQPAPPVEDHDRDMDREMPEVPRQEEERIEDEEVVGIPDRKRFHRPECRYAKVAGGVPMAAAEARRRGYDACRICKP